MSTTLLGTRPTSVAADRPRISKRRVFIYAMLFAMTAVNYTDRVNLSVSAGLVSHEFGLSPAELGWLLSAYLWPYIICLAPAGLLVDWLGYRLVGWVAVGFWSLCTAATAFVKSPFPFYLTRMGLGGAEAANFPIGTQAIRAWAPRRGIRRLGCLDVARPMVRHRVRRHVRRLDREQSRLARRLRADRHSRPDLGGDLGTVRARSAARKLAGRRGARLHPARAGGAAGAAGGRRQRQGLLSSRSLWALSLAQGCFVYEAYMLLSWLPNFLQTQHHVSIFSSGGYTAIIYGTAVLGSILLARLSDKIFSTKALRGGARKWVVAFSYLPAMLVAVVPQVNSVWVIVALLTVSVTFLANGISLNTALCNDLVVRPADAGTAVALFTLGANLVGFVSPIVTGYVVQATGSFNMAFVLTGLMLLLGVAILLGLIKGGIGKADPSMRAQD